MPKVLFFLYLSKLYQAVAILSRKRNKTYIQGLENNLKRARGRLKSREAIIEAIAKIRGARI
jgi:hypothetical protein